MNTRPVGFRGAWRELASACVYCGLPSLGEPACRGHEDLLAADPAYDLAGHLSAIAYPALALDRAPSALHREGPPLPLDRPLAASPEAL